MNSFPLSSPPQLLQPPPPPPPLRPKSLPLLPRIQHLIQHTNMNQTMTSPTAEVKQYYSSSTNELLASPNPLSSASIFTTHHLEIDIQPQNFVQNLRALKLLQLASTPVFQNQEELSPPHMMLSSAGGDSCVSSSSSNCSSSSESAGSSDSEDRLPFFEPPTSAFDGHVNIIELPLSHRRQSCPSKLIVAIPKLNKSFMRNITSSTGGTLGHHVEDETNDIGRGWDSTNRGFYDDDDIIEYQHVLASPV